MKNKKIEKNLQSALRENQPRVWDQIATRTGIGQEVKASEQVLVTEGAPQPRTQTQGKQIGWSISAVVLVIAFILAVLLPILLSSTPFSMGDSIFVDINPSIQLTLTDQGKVDEVIPLNDDAVILLASENENSFKGKTPQKAVEKIWQLAYETGFLSPERMNNALLLSTAFSDEKKGNEIRAELKNGLNQVIQNKGVYCLVLTETSGQSHKEEADGFGITVGKFNLIQRAIELGAEIFESEYAKISVSEINSRIANGAKQRYNEGKNENFLKENEKLREEAEKVNSQHQKKETFEEEFDRWQSDFYQAYHDNWKDMREEWQQSHGWGNLGGNNGNHDGRNDEPNGEPNGMGHNPPTARWW